MRRAAIRFAICSLLVLVLFPELPRMAVVDWPDDLLQLVSDLVFWREQLSSGALPLWNPWRLNGSSAFAALPSLGPFYPFVPLTLWWPIGAVVPLGFLLHLVIAGVGMVRLMEHLGVRGVGAWLAVVASLGGTASATALVDGQLDVMALLAWWPWAARPLLSPHPLGAAPFLALMALGGHTRFAALQFLGLGLLGAVHLRWPLRAAPASASRSPSSSTGQPGDGRGATRLGWLALALGLGGGLAAVGLLPVVLESGALRPALPIDVSDLPGQALTPLGLLGLLYPRSLVIDERWYSVGRGLLLVGLAAAPRLRDGPSSVPAHQPLRGVLLAATVLLLLGMGEAGPLFPLAWLLRPLLFPVETGAAAAAMPLLCVALGLAVEALRSRPAPLRSIGLAAALGAIWVIGGWWADRWLYPHAGPALRQQQLGNLGHGLAGLVVAGAAAWALGRRQRLAVALVGLLMLDVAVGCWRIQAALPSRPLDLAAWLNRADPGDAVQRDGVVPPRIAAWPLEPVGGEHLRLEDPPIDLGPGFVAYRDPLAEVRSEARGTALDPLGGSVRRGRWLRRVDGRLKLVDPDQVWLVQRISNLRAQGQLDELARWAEYTHLEALVGRGPAPQLADWEQRTAPDGRWLLRNPAPRPPALLSPQLAISRTPAVVERLARSPLLDPRHTALVHGGFEEDLLTGPGPATALTVLAWRPGYWRIALDGRAGVVSVADQHHRGWRARVDGRPIAAQRVNLNQLGVVVAPEMQLLELRFQPPGLFWGALVSALSLALWAGLSLRRHPLFRRRAAPLLSLLGALCLGCGTPQLGEDLEQQADDLYIARGGAAAAAFLSSEAEALPQLHPRARELRWLAARYRLLAHVDRRAAPLAGTWEGRTVWTVAPCGEPQGGTRLHLRPGPSGDMVAGEAELRFGDELLGWSGLERSGGRLRGEADLDGCVLSLMLSPVAEGAAADRLELVLEAAGPDCRCPRLGHGPLQLQPDSSAQL